MTTKQAVQEAFNAAAKKYDTPRRLRPKSRDGTKETNRELRDRINKLHLKVEEM